VIRPSIDLYFMRMASVAASRATCPRKSVGAVIVRDRRVLSTGYNGSIAGQPHCTEVGCMMVDNHCERTIHSEANAIVQAARNGVNIEGGSIYVTASPCFNCFKLIAGAGLKRIVFGELYRDARIKEFSAQCAIGLTDMTAPTRCGRCNTCSIEKDGSCACDGACDDGCFLCSPENHTRPPCPAVLLEAVVAERSWAVRF
jgi:dCMP deaminase